VYSATQVQPQEGFVNPYNFIPLVGKVPRKPPESHELWKGHSGQIICKMTLKTPFFFPDTERRCKNAEGHERLYLLRDAENRAIIPGSELKGAFSAVAEAFANGCLRVFDDTMHFGYRPAPNEFLNLKRRQGVWEAGIVKALPTSEQPGKIAICQVAKVRFRKPLRGGRWFDDVKDARNGEHLHLRVREGRVTWATRQGTPDENPEGYMNITDVPDVNTYKAAKKSQRWFYNESEDKWVGFTEAVAQNYNAIHAIGFQRDARDTSFQVNVEDVPHKWALPDEEAEHKGGLRPRRHPLRVGDLVYCVLRKPFNQMEADERGIDDVEMLLAAEVGRVRYQQGVADGLPDEFALCKDADKLCPVCRLWGWVPPGKEEQNDGEEKSRQGFIRFSTAHTVSALKETDVEANVTLSPLGQPHASAMSFYLQSPDNPREVGTYGKQNEPYREFALRGRKFYWHQEPRGQWRDTRDNGQPKQDSQNKTVELLKEGVTFTFMVEFDNLSDEDLGLLLLTLQPNLLGEKNIPSQHLYHHLGMGKPLGLGSAKVVIDKLTLINRAERYQSLTADGKTSYEQAQLAQPNVQKFIDAFVEEALKAQDIPLESSRNRRQFATLQRIEALLFMLDWEHKPEGIRYPPGPSDKSEESFRWFMDVNERLLTPREIADGKRQKPYP
jgi:CRISPR-associated protein (TIGR03986 family)